MGDIFYGEVPRFVFFLDFRAEVKLSATSEAIWDTGWDGSGAGFGLPLGFPHKSQVIPCV